MSLKSIILFILCVIYSIHFQAANRYWVAPSSGNWNNTANWSTTSGGPGGASVPVASDNAIFDSFTTSNCSINSTLSVAGFSVIGYNGTISQAANSMTIGANGYYQNSGTFTGGSANITLLDGDFRLAGGSFLSTAAVLYIGGTQTAGNATLFNHSSGTFGHNNGLIVFNPKIWTCTQYIYTIDVLPTTLFYDIEVNLPFQTCTNHILTTASGDVVNAANNFTHTDGIINGLFTLDNNLTINSTADGGVGTITFDGTGAQTYYQAAGSQRTCKIAVNKASGAVTPAVGNVDFTVQGFNQILGDFTAPSGNFSIGGDLYASQTVFNHQAGTFSHNNGKVIFDGKAWTCSQYTYSVNVITSTQFYDVDVNLPFQTCTNHKLGIATNDTIYVSNNLRYIDGVCDAQFEAVGNVTVSSTFDGGNGKLIFAGNNPQTFDLTSATGLFNGSLVLNKTISNNVTLLSACILDAGASQSITFNKGIFVSSSTNLLTIGNAGTVSNANDSSYVRGPVRKIGNQAFAFPVGKERFNGKKYYRAIRMSAPSVNTDHFTAEYFPIDPDPTYTTTSKDILLNHISRCEYWILDRTNGTSNVNVTLSWRDSTSCGVTNLSELRVARWDGTTWKDHGNGGATGTINSGTVVTSAVVTAFSPFTLASSTANNPLPIELISFNASCELNSVKLKWTTASERNNLKFEIEKSEDAQYWSSIKEVKGQINSFSTTNYEVYDSVVDKQIAYYRLKQIDLNQKFSYSNIISANCKQLVESNISIFPNPSSGLFNIHGNGNSFDVYVFNTIGELVCYKKGLIDKLDLTEYASGVYLITIIQKEQSQNYKLVLQH